MTLTGHNTTTWVLPEWARGSRPECPHGCTRRIQEASDNDAVPWCGKCVPPTNSRNVTIQAGMVASNSRPGITLVRTFYAINREAWPSTLDSINTGPIP